MKTRILISVLTAAMLTCLAGCLEDDATMIARYQAGNDQFALLTVYQHFRSSGSDPEGRQFSTDALKLEMLWAARDRIIPIEPSIFGQPIYMELTSDHKSLANGAGDATLGAISWDQIKIVPGKLFSDKDGALNYYHEVWIPGAVIDQWLAVARQKLAKNDELLKLLAGEKARREKSATRGSWKEFREKALRAQAASLDGLEQKPVTQPDNQTMPAEFLACLDNDSFAAFQKAIQAASLEITRQGQTVTIRLPFTKPDSEEAAALLKDLGKRWSDFAQRKQTEDAPMAAIARLVFGRLAGAVGCNATDRGLELSVALADAENAIASSFAQITAKAYQAKPESIAAAKKIAKAVGPKVSVTAGVTVESIIADFLKRAGN